MTADGSWVDEVIRFWFEETSPESWFSHDAALDATLLERFNDLVEPVSRLKPGASASPRAALAIVLVLDQFPRNLYRGTAQAFATDALALEHSSDAIDRKLDAGLPVQQRMFLYMPWQHAEDAAAQSFSVDLFEKLGMEESLTYAREHKRIIDLFGRFPHRNAALGRTSTPEEVAFMKTHAGF